jgi:alkane 1-monooxygenase
MIRPYKYLSPFIIYAGALHSFTTTGWEIWLPLAWAWIIVPLAELMLQPDPRNLGKTEEELARADRTYDAFLYLVVIAQYAALFLFLRSVSFADNTWYDTTGRILVMGLLCGTFGINVGHELGHRVTHTEQTLAKLLLLTSLYMHFFIEHNKGHHKRVATPEDPSSARYGETIYAFYVRTIWFSYWHAWAIANRDQRKRGRPALNFRNEMFLYQVIQILFLTTIVWIFGWWAALCFLAAALMGILLLETVNYIEHYGLQRQPVAGGGYERAMPAHSWNSNHIIGRLMLFELSRHSDHHYMASRKYQVLRHHDNSPQMPTGYPGMMILSLFPPAWFYVMHRRIRALPAH